MNILLIEDEILIQKSLKKLLENKGACVLTSRSGSEGVSLLKSKKFDLIICDLMLEDISGFDVIEESKNVFTEEEIRIKFVIITAYGSTSVENKALTYGCPIIKKPFNNLSEIIDLFISKAKSNYE